MWKIYASINNPKTCKIEKLSYSVDSWDDILDSLLDDETLPDDILEISITKIKNDY